MRPSSGDGQARSSLSICPRTLRDLPLHHTPPMHTILQAGKTECQRKGDLRFAPYLFLVAQLEKEFKNQKPKALSCHHPCALRNIFTSPVPAIGQTDRGQNPGVSQGWLLGSAGKAVCCSGERPADPVLVLVPTRLTAGTLHHASQGLPTCEPLIALLQ